MDRGGDTGWNVSVEDRRSALKSPRQAGGNGKARGRDRAKQEGGDERDERRCANCGLPLSWPSILVNGIEYCCGGCAQGGPCYCSYDS